MDNPIPESRSLQAEIDDSFWSPRLSTNRKVTMTHQYEQLEESGCLDNFRIAAGNKEGQFRGMWFSDSDAYKWLEAASYVFEKHPDQELKNRMDQVISLVSEAQEDDGYLNTYFTIKEPEKKWTNLSMMHELYCGGHLLEAATAHRKATGEAKLLEVARNFADHVEAIFGPDGRLGYPGHEEIEIGLLKLYDLTGDKSYYKLADFFISQRGYENSPLEKEFKNIDSIAGGEVEKRHQRKLFSDEDGNYDGSYAQDHRPLLEQEKTIGHSVRATYLYTAATKLADQGGDKELSEALERLWKNMTNRRMYITGGIGSTHDHEGFTSDYHLPNKSAYAETCAAVGSIFWNQEMFNLTGESRFQDLIERTLYNGFLSGVGLEGKTFFYENPLASDGSHHRKGWFPCACCPPNAARLLASLERYVYSLREGSIYLNQFISGSMGGEISGVSVRIKQRTDYPWEGESEITINPEKPVNFPFKIRIPSWSDEYNLQINGERLEKGAQVEDGYLRLNRSWQPEDRVQVSFPMSVEQIVAHQKVQSDVGRIALKRGPIVYCLEETDHSQDLDEIYIPQDVKFQTDFESDLLDGVVTLTGQALVAKDGVQSKKLYQKRDSVSYEQGSLKAIPYYGWDNREPGSMRVWLKRIC